MKTFTAALLGLASIGLAQNYMEKSSWAFQGGNLVANWSFENLTTEICRGDAPGWGGTLTGCRERSIVARTGNYIMAINAKNEGDTATQPWAISQISKLIPAEPSTAYTFSVHMRVSWSERIPSSAPVVCWMRADKSFIGCGQGQPYLEAFPGDLQHWTPYSFEFSTAPDAQYIYFHMVQSANDGVTGQSGDYYEFDDLQIRRSSQSAGVLESRIYADAVGRPDHTIINDGAKDVITKREYDAQGRLYRDYLPVTRGSGISGGEFVVSENSLNGEMTVDYATLLEAYTDLSGRVMATDRTALPADFTIYAVVEAGGQEAALGPQPFLVEAFMSRDGVEIPITLQGLVRGSAAYWDLASRHQGPVSGHWSQGPFYGDYQALLTQQYPGQSNLFTQVEYPASGGTSLLSRSLPGTLYGPSSHVTKSGSALLTIPTIPSNVEYNGSVNAEALYSYSWSKDAQGKYSAEIRDARGLVVKTAVSDAANPTSEADWIITTYNYDQWGRPTVLSSPKGLATTSQFDGLGLITQVTDPDRGMREFLYDSLGQVRFTRSAEGRSGNWFVAVQFDPKGRVLGKGRVNLASTNFTQANADNANFPGVANLNEGALYDALEPAQFQEATGTPLSSLGFTPPLKNVQGRITVAFNRNSYVAPPGTWTQANLLAATFFSYDSEGRVIEVWKYIGAAPAGRRWHKIKYDYDLQGRPLSITTFHDQTENQVVLRSGLRYDVRNRITQIDDATGQPLAQYAYDFLDRDIQVRLPGGLSVDYAFDVQGKPTLITGSAPGQQLFQELLGYETKPHAQISDNLLLFPRYDGKISSLVHKFSDNASNPVEWWRYDYDAAGRMVDSWKHRPNLNGNLLPDGRINYPVQFDPAPSTSRGYVYDDDGAIVAMDDGATTYAYNYPNTSHMLNAVSPNLPGRTTSAGSFVFDQNGRLHQDVGTGKTFTYNYADRPVRLIMPGLTFHYLYDENGNRVASLEERSGALAGRTLFVYEKGLKKVKELVIREATHPDGAVDVARYHEHGRSGLVALSYSGAGGRHVLMKDHQGSVMMAVNLNGSVAKEQGYLPYGSIEQRVVDGGDLLPSETFTGKEFDDLSGLYYFGARFYDPALGMWITPDKAGQFFSPYAYGVSPVNGLDPDGNWFLVDDAIAAAVGAVIGAGVAIYNGYDPTDAQFWGYTVGGAALAWVTYNTAGAAAAAFGGGSTVAGGAAGGAVAGSMTGLGNYTLQSGIETGFESFEPMDAWDATWKGAAVGAVTGGLDSYIGMSRASSLWTQAGHGFAKGATAGLVGVGTSDLLDDGKFNSGTGAYLAGGLVGGGIGAAQSVHYARNLRNNETLNRPGWEDAKNRGGCMSGNETCFHQQGLGNAGNIKSVNLDGSEVIINNSGNIVRDPVNMGTYNYVNNSTSSLGHTAADVLPYFIFGNSPDHALRYPLQGWMTEWMHSY